MALPPEAKGAPQWQDAAEALLMAAEGRGPLMHARIGGYGRSIGTSSESSIQRAKTHIRETETEGDN
jgi:hypothetical protein